MRRHGCLYYHISGPVLPCLFICESVRLSYRKLYYAHERLLDGWLAAMLLST